MPKKHESSMKILSMEPAGIRDLNDVNRDYDWVALKHYDSLTIVVVAKAQSGQTPTLRLRQAKDAAGTGAKDLAGEHRWFRASDDSAVGERFAAAFGSTEQLSTGVDVVRVEVTGDQLDVDNDFSHVTVRASRSGNQAGKSAAVVGILCSPRYEQPIEHQFDALA